MKKLFVKFYSSVPAEENIFNISGVVPFSVSVKEETETPMSGEVIMSNEEYQAYVQLHGDIIASASNIETFNISEYKEQAKLIVKQWYESEKIKPENGIFSTILGKQINGGEVARDDVSSLIKLSIDEPTCISMFKCFDNTYTSKEVGGAFLSITTLETIEREIIKYGYDLFWIKEQKLAMISVAETKEQIDLIIN